MNHLDIGFLEHRQPLRRVITGRLHHFDATFDDHLEKPRVVRRLQRWKERHVHAKGLVGHFAATGDLGRQFLGRSLSQPRQDPQPTRVRHRSGHLGQAHKMHSALNDWMLNTEEFRDASFHKFSSLMRVG